MPLRRNPDPPTIVPVPDETAMHRPKSFLRLFLGLSGWGAVLAALFLLVVRLAS